MKTIKVLLVIICVLLVGIFFWVLQKPETNVSSVAVSNDYYSTTTGALGQTFDMIQTLKTGQGSFGSIIVTGTGTGRLTIYNATTSNANLRDSSQSTSTIYMADIKPTATYGTYTFDTLFTRGLLVVWEGTKATLGTTTITWR